MRRLIEAIDQIVRAHSIRLISVDVFDTLLLRATRPELARFADVAADQATALAAVGMPVDPVAIYAARLVAARTAYRCVGAVQGEREGRHGDILSMVAAALRLDPSAVPVLAAAELDHETKVMVGNRALAEALMRHRAEGRRVVFASDMYLPATAIHDLIARLLPSLVLDGGYSSADHGVTKRGGGLFQVMMRAEDVAANEVLHFGDSLLADVETPRRAGIHAIHVPRPRVWRGIHGVRHRVALLRHRAMMRRPA
ncbi:MAG: hydrolase [Alphaproteobacteria bacterium]